MSKQPDRSRRLGLQAALLFASLAVLAAAALLSRRPQWVELYYSEGWSNAWGTGLSLLSGQTSGSLAEILILALLLWLGVSALLGLRRIRQGRCSWRQSLRKGMLRLLTVAAVVAALFYITWGLNYSRPPMADRMGWQQWSAQENSQQGIEELSRLCLQLVEAANQAYRQAHGGPNWQQGKAPLKLTEIDAAIDEGFRKSAARLTRPAWAASRGAAKPSRISLLMSYLGISGIYLPFTAEAHFNSMVPHVELAHTMAHEKAHQRGIASEDEASMAGFLACLDSGLPYVRYSGLVFAQRRLLAELHRRDPEQARQLVSKRLQAVQEDITSANQFWRSFEGPAAQVSEKVNDTYLRFHGVPGGIDSYGLSSRLLILYARSQGGTLF